MMQSYQFHQTDSLEEALEILHRRAVKCAVIAGGTDLLPTLRKEEAHPEHVLNLMNIAELSGIEESNGRIHIGPTTTFTDLAGSEILNEALPLLVEAAKSVGGPQIRNRGTIGGNIVTSSPAADVLPAVMALEAKVELRRRGGTRVLPLAEAVIGPYENCLAGNELLTKITIDKPASGSRQGFFKLGRRKALARARMNLSVLLHLNGEGLIQKASIVAGAVMPVARKVPAAEAALIGTKADEEALEAAALELEKEMVAASGIRWSTEYKAPVLKNVFKRVMKGMLAEDPK